MGHHIFFFSVIFITLVAFSSGADSEFTVKIHQRYLLACSESNDLRPGNFKYIDWYRCSPNLKKDGCDSDGKTVLIVQLKFTRETKVYNRDFDVYTNGTLVIKKVLPMDDGEMFVCSAFVRYIKRANFTVILNIDKEPPKLIPKSPLSIEVIEGTTLYMDTEVQGYPYPWVTWSHNELLLKETPNVDSETFLRIRNVTVDKKGRYTCFANNQLGNSSFTVSVKVKAKAAISEKSFMPTRPNFPTNLGQLVTTTAASDFHTPPSSLPSDFQTPPSLLTSNFQTPPFSLTSNFQSPPYSLTSETQSPSGSPPPTLNSVSTANCECPCWAIYVLIACLVIAVVIIACLVVKRHNGSSQGHRDENHLQNAGFELERRDDNQPANQPLNLT